MENETLPIGIEELEERLSELLPKNSTQEIDSNIPELTKKLIKVGEEKVWDAADYWQFPPGGSPPDVR